MQSFVLILFLLPLLIVATTCPNDPYKDNCPNECAVLYDHQGCSLCTCSADSIGQKEMLKAKTKFSYFNATFSWTIEKFQIFNFGTRYDSKILASPVLRAIDYTDGNKVYNVVIKIEPDFQHTYDIYSFDIYASFPDNKPSRRIIYFQINNGTIYTGQQIQKSNFTSILDNVEITVKAVFSKNVTFNGSTSSLSSVSSYDDEPASLGNELLKMFRNDSELSFVIECAGEEITAVKYVMKARSALFRELLSNDTDRIRITDFEPKIVRKMIEFCHNDSIENFEAEETSVFTIAYKYKTQSLMSYTSKKIAESATIDNAIAHFKFAHFYGHEKLKKWFFKYIIENFSEVSKTKAFKSLDDELYKPVLEELINQNKIS